MRNLYGWQEHLFFVMVVVLVACNLSMKGLCCKDSLIVNVSGLHKNDITNVKHAEIRTRKKNTFYYNFHLKMLMRSPFDQNPMRVWQEQMDFLLYKFTLLQCKSICGLVFLRLMEGGKGKKCLLRGHFLSWIKKKNLTNKWGNISPWLKDLYLFLFCVFFLCFFKCFSDNMGYPCYVSLSAIVIRL